MARHAGWLLVLILVIATGAARADSTAPSPNSLYADWLHGWSQGVDLGGREAMTIGMDPETGTWILVPTLATGLQLSMAPTETRIQRADGGVEVIVSPGIIEYLMARRSLDGRSRIHCLTAGERIPGAADPSDWPVK